MMTHIIIRFRYKPYVDIHFRKQENMHAGDFALELLLPQFDLRFIIELKFKFNLI